MSITEIEGFKINTISNVMMNLGLKFTKKGHVGIIKIKVSQGLNLYELLHKVVIEIWCRYHPDIRTCSFPFLLW